MLLKKLFPISAVLNHGTQLKSFLVGYRCLMTAVLHYTCTAFAQQHNELFHRVYGELLAHD